MAAEATIVDLSEHAHAACPTMRRSPGILIAHNMALVLTMLKFELEFRGFNVWLAVDGNDALDLYRRFSDQIDLVVIEGQLSGSAGDPRTLADLQRFNPNVVVCLVTDNANTYPEESLPGIGVAAVFTTPFRLVEVADSLQRLVGATSETEIDIQD